ncbi:LamG-like jellyroll fold domain-containing protein [Actinomadura alba]|uniref:LamG-like jellyroll fold domain-containing protein n=1 Tax=Actinomadura alba TaxID=406431 RepID=A0ABR7LYT5_9ACTN|nr:LamG-like jellyroll fold domain-containing protein [Actinomadura alba]MBC6469662.1 hypothetical protein [Actinomadura alba]
MSANGSPPDPDEALSVADFVALLRGLKGWSGLTYRELEKRALDNGDFLPRSTISTALGRGSLPREDLVRALVTACGCDSDTVDAWLSARRRLAAGPDVARLIAGRPVDGTADEVSADDDLPSPLPRGRLRRWAAWALLPAVAVATLIGVASGAVPGLPRPGSGASVSPRPSGPAGTAPIPDPAAWWRFEEAGGSTVSDSSGRGRTATLRGGVERVAGASGGGALLFDGAGHAATKGPVVRTDAAFTVTAWVRNDAPDRWTTVINQHDGTYPAFLINYDPDHSEWALMMPHPVSGSISGDRGLFSGVPAARGKWVHLAAVSDPGAGQVSLYTDGVLAKSGPGTAMRRGDGPLDLGRGWRDGRAIDGWRGAIDDVRVFDRALTGGQIREVLSRRT